MINKIIENNHIKLFVFDLNNLNQADIKKALFLLDQYELKKSSQYTNPKSKNAFIFCRAQTKNIISEFTNQEPETISFSYTKSGKPYLKGSKINFNISHSHDFGLVGISDKSIGVDIEKINDKRDWQSIAKSIFGNGELSWINKQSNPCKSFYLLWTLKEARLKCDDLKKSSSIFEEVFFNANLAPTFHKYKTYSITHDSYQISAVTAE